MNDKIRYDYAEAQVEITCAVCDTVFPGFPDADNPSIPCPKCGREFVFVYKIVPQNTKNIIKKRLRDYRLTK